MTRGRILLNIRLVGKEKIITIVIGVVVGVALAGAFFAFYQFKGQLMGPARVAPAPSPAPTSAEELTTVSLNTPEDNTITKDRSIELTGRGPAQAKLLVVSSSEEKSLKITADGSFKAAIRLEEGENRILVVFFDQTGEPKTLGRTVTVEI